MVVCALMVLTHTAVHAFKVMLALIVKSVIVLIYFFHVYSTFQTLLICMDCESLDCVFHKHTVIFQFLMLLTFICSITVEFRAIQASFLDVHTANINYVLYIFFCFENIFYALDNAKYSYITDEISTYINEYIVLIF